MVARDQAAASGRTAAVAVVLTALLASSGAAPRAQDSLSEFDAFELKVLTYNVWHGRRTEGAWKFPGDDPERTERRFAWQIEQIRQLDPDVLLLQEVNPNKHESQKYAEALGYEVIHKVTNCGIHLPPLKIPVNMNEGLAILARPALHLERVGSKKLSGPGNCTAKFGFQTKESRFALFGGITVKGRRVLLVSTHLHNAPWVLPGFEEQVDALVSEGKLSAEQRGAILGKLEKRRARQLDEAATLLEAAEALRQAYGFRYVVLGGDLNSVPDSAVVANIERAGYRSATPAGPGFYTFDPVGNAQNIGIGSKSKTPLPTYDVPELQDLLESRRELSRQIDHIFSWGGLEGTHGARALDGARDGLIGSDHYGLVTQFRESSGG